MTEEMTDSLLIKGGHIIDPGTGTDIIGSALITNSKIDWIGDGEPPGTDYDVLDVEGLIVCPGFIDMHCHLRQPGFEDSETIATGTQAAARGGFTTLCCMPNTNPPLDNEGVLNYLRTIAAMEGIIRVLHQLRCAQRRQEQRRANAAPRIRLCRDDTDRPPLAAYRRRGRRHCRPRP